MSYEATIIADSVAPHGIRLTTFTVTFPRFILAELNTHRMLSRNSASSRAIPTEKIIQRVLENPFVPETFNKRVKGMGVGEVLATSDQITCQKAWLYARDKSVQAAHVLVDAGVDKSRVNRLLEPFMWHTALVTATEWSNFFALRDHPDAQPEFQILARMMRESMDASSPQELGYGEWHLPLLSDEERSELRHEETLSQAWGDRPLPGAEANRMKWAKVSAGRCFKVSYDRVTDDEDPADSFRRSETAPDSGHWSPLEHPAMAVESDVTFISNFRGWRQLRKFFAAEDDFQKVLNAESSPV
jgi:thymidylate synthase ThyX